MESFCKVKKYKTHTYRLAFSKSTSADLQIEGIVLIVLIGKLPFHFFVKNTNGHQKCASKIVLAKIKFLLEKSVWSYDIPVWRVSDMSGQQYQLTNT